VVSGVATEVGSDTISFEEVVESFFVAIPTETNTVSEHNYLL
jgi:hypothetical protein